MKVLDELHEEAKTERARALLSLIKDTASVAKRRAERCLIRGLLASMKDLGTFSTDYTRTPDATPENILKVVEHLANFREEIASILERKCKCVVEE